MWEEEIVKIQDSLSHPVSVALSKGNDDVPEYHFYA